MLDVYCYIADLYKVIIGDIHKLTSISFSDSYSINQKTIHDNVLTKYHIIRM